MIITRRLNHSATSLLLLFACLWLMACRDSPLEKNRANVRDVLNSISIRDFTKTGEEETQTIGFVFFGPATFDAANDVSGRSLVLNVPPDARSSDSIYKDIANGHALARDGTRCFVVLEQSQPQGPKLSYWHLSDEQERQRQNGTAIVVLVTAVCGNN